MAVCLYVVRISVQPQYKLLRGGRLDTLYKGSLLPGNRLDRLLDILRGAAHIQEGDCQASRGP